MSVEDSEIAAVELERTLQEVYRLTIIADVLTKQLALKREADIKLMQFGTLRLPGMHPDFGGFQRQSLQ